MLKKFWTFLFGLGMGLLGGLLAAGLILMVLSEPRGEPIELLPLPTPSPLQVYVSGAVAAPGVYLIPESAILEEALIKAGGTLPEADLSHLNLASTLSAGQNIFVPTIDPDHHPAPNGSDLDELPSLNARLNVNQATAAELEMLPGIGPVLAKKIIEHRTTHGLFTKPEDLLEVSGIGPSTYEDIRDFIIIP